MSKPLTFANAPCSWGVFYPDGNSITPAEYLAAIARSGYRETELGPLGYFGEDPAEIARMLAAHDLSVIAAAHVHVFSDPSLDDTLFESLARIAAVLKPLGAGHIILMDESEAYPKEAMGVLSAEAEAHAFGLIARAGAYTRDELGMALHFHPHVGTFVETGAQIGRLLAASDVSLCFDTGHHAYWGQDALAFLDASYDRIGLVHLKNVDPAVRARVLSGDLGIDASFAAGVMSPLDQGAVDIPAVVRLLQARGFDGPVVVEQDPSEDPSHDPEALAARNLAYLQSAVETRDA